MVITVVINSAPNQQTALLMPPLYASAYAVRKIYKQQGQVFSVDKLRGCWPQVNINLAKQPWRGIYALQVPNSVNQLPEIAAAKNPHNIQLTLQQW